MSEFSKFTSGFNVNGTTVGLEAAKITTATNGVTTVWTAGAVPTTDAIDTHLTTGDFKVASAVNADNAAKLGGQDASSYATTAALYDISQDVATLEGYFTDGAANKALAADKLSNEITLTTTGDAVVTYEGVDGSGNVTGKVQITSVPFSALPTTNSGSMVANKVMDAENIAAYVDSKIAGVYKVKGSCAESELPTDAEVGDVWNLTAVNTGSSFLVGDNVVWTNDGWDRLAGTIDVQGKLDTTAFNTWSAGRFDGTTAKVAANAEKLGGETAAAVIASANKGAAASAWIDTSAGDIGDAIIYASDWNTSKTGLLTSANKGAAASAWIDANAESLLKEVSTTGSVTGKGTTSNPIGLATTAVTALAAVDGKLGKTEAASTYATITALDGLSDTVGELAEDVAENTSNISTLSNVVAGMRYYAKVSVKNGEGTAVTAQASMAADTIGFVAGNGITLTTGSDGGNPTITVAADGANFSITGTEPVTVTTGTGSDGKKTFTVGVAEATTAAAGVVKADYYNEADGLIYLF